MFKKNEYKERKMHMNCGPAEQNYNIQKETQSHGEKPITKR